MFIHVCNNQIEHMVSLCCFILDNYSLPFLSECILYQKKMKPNYFEELFFILLIYEIRLVLFVIKASAAVTNESLYVEIVIRVGLHGRSLPICSAVQLRPYLNILNGPSSESVDEVDGPSSSTVHLRQSTTNNHGIPSDSVHEAELKFWSDVHMNAWTVRRRPFSSVEVKFGGFLSAHKLKCDTSTIVSRSNLVPPIT